MCGVIVLRLASLLFLVDFVVAQSCYWPNGKELTSADNFVSCAANGIDGQCCQAGHACMSNGLCFNPGKGAVYRGGCTDENWTTDACPRFCNDITGLQSGTAPMAMCPPDADGNWKWWCGQDMTNVCGEPDENTASFEYPSNATIVKIAGVDHASPTTAATKKEASATTTSIEQASATPRTINVNGDRVPKFMPIAIGIGVGVPLVMIAITLGFFWWKERKRRIIAEKMGFAGNAITMAKQSYEVEISAVKPALKHSPSKSRMTRQPSKSAMARQRSRSDP